MREDTNVLFYNVFGFAEITADKITVSLNMSRDGRIQGRLLDHELADKLTNVSARILLPFGAWVEADDIQFTAGRLEGYDVEAYMANQAIIDKVILSALELIKGAVTQ